MKCEADPFRESCVLWIEQTVEILAEEGYRGIGQYSGMCDDVSFKRHLSKAMDNNAAVLIFWNKCSDIENLSLDRHGGPVSSYRAEDVENYIRDKGGAEIEWVDLEKADGLIIRRGRDE